MHAGERPPTGFQQADCPKQPRAARESHFITLWKRTFCVDDDKSVTYCFAGRCSLNWVRAEASVDCASHMLISLLLQYSIPPPTGPIEKGSLLSSFTDQMGLSSFASASSVSFSFRTCRLPTGGQDGDWEVRWENMTSPICWSLRL